MSGRLVAVVGPSGVGKDTVMAALARRRPSIHLVRRVVTRPPQDGGEPFEPVDAETFAAREAGGAFALSWHAHGLSYGVPRVVDHVLDSGQDAFVNLSRGVLDRAARRFPRFAVLSLTAPPEVLSRRLRRRGRETAGDIARRLDREGASVPPGVTVHEVTNDGPLEETVDAVLAAFYPENV